LRILSFTVLIHILYGNSSCKSNIHKELYVLIMSDFFIDFIS